MQLQSTSRPVKDNVLQLAQRLINIGIALSTESDLDRFFQLIVNEAKSLTAADAASLYLRQGDRLRFKTLSKQYPNPMGKDSPFFS